MVGTGRVVEYFLGIEDYIVAISVEMSAIGLLFLYRGCFHPRRRIYRE